MKKSQLQWNLVTVVDNILLINEKQNIDIKEKRKLIKDEVLKASHYALDDVLVALEISLPEKHPTTKDKCIEFVEAFSKGYNRCRELVLDTIYKDR